MSTVFKGKVTLNLNLKTGQHTQDGVAKAKQQSLLWFCASTTG